MSEHHDSAASMSRDTLQRSAHPEVIVYHGDGGQGGHVIMGTDQLVGQENSSVAYTDVSLRQCLLSSSESVGDRRPTRVPVEGGCDRPPRSKPNTPLKGRRPATTLINFRSCK